MERLNDQQIKAAMAAIDTAWMVKGKFIHREILFKNFIEAFSFTKTN